MFVKLFALLKPKRGWMQRGVIDPMDMLVWVILAAIAFPFAIDTFIDVDTSGWPTQVSDLWDKLPLFLVIAAVLGVLYFARRGSKKS